MYEIILNFLIRNNFLYLNKIIFKLFKFFLKKRIVLNFLKYKFYAYPQKKEISRWMIKNLEIWDKDSVEMIILYLLILVVIMGHILYLSLNLKTK